MTTPTPMTRKERKAAKQKAWIATPPGHIAKPLRHIGNRIKSSTHPLLLAARRAAQSGDGLTVQQIARSLK